MFACESDVLGQESSYGWFILVPFGILIENKVFRHPRELTPVSLEFLNLLQFIDLVATREDLSISQTENELVHVGVWIHT